MKNFMGKYSKVITTFALTAAGVTAIVLLSILLANKFTVVADWVADVNLPNRDEIISDAIRDIWGLFIANITMFAWIVASWFFICWEQCKKRKNKTKNG